MLSSAIDDLVVTASTLATGIQYVEQFLGCKMQPGGQHPRMGTYNALLKIGEYSYLEVISIDPDAEPPCKSAARNGGAWRAQSAAPCRLRLSDVQSHC